LIAPTLIAFGLGVGLLAASKGLSVGEIALMSAWVYAGGAQMATLQVWTEPLPVFALVLTVLAMNARYILLSASLRPYFGTLPFWQVYPGLAIFGDGNWMLQMREVNEGRRPDAGFLLGSGLVMILPWTASTVAGHLFGQILGDPRRFGIDFLLAAFFAVMSVGFLRRAQHRAACRGDSGRGGGAEAGAGALVPVRRRARRQPCGSVACRSGLTCSRRSPCWGSRRSPAASAASS
jgi:predicted branched-subunit amino acid permease